METIEIATPDGACPAHIARPAGTGPWPAVIVFIDGLGMRPAILEIAERIAALGYYAIAPDLFYRVGPYTAPDPAKLFGDPDTRKAWFEKVSAAAKTELIARDVVSTIAFLDGQADVVHGRYGATGYCMGGRLALLAAAAHPDRIAAVGAFHPGGLVTDAADSPHLAVGTIRGTVYVAGATDDASFTDAHKATLAEALAAANVRNTVVTYPAKHGWVPTDTPIYDAAQAERHYQALDDLFGATLR